MVWALLAVVVLLGANAFFVAVEFALVASRSTRIEPLAAQGRRAATLGLAAMKDLNTQLAGAQLGITMASLALGFVAEPAVGSIIERLLGTVVDPESAAARTVSIVVTLVIIVFFHMVLGEMIPKNVAIADPERTLLRLAVANRAYMVALRPVILLLNAMASGLVRLAGVEPRDELHAGHTADELAAMLRESAEEGMIEDFAHALLSGALDFGERRVDSVMVPEDSVVTVGASSTVAEIEETVVARGHSRLPVVADGGSLPLGFVHGKDLLSLSPAAHGRPLPSRMVRRMLRVPVDRTLADLLLSMRVARVHLAVVTDEAGRMVGLVTLEDLLEALVGEILDESDRTG